MLLAALTYVAVSALSGGFNTRDDTTGKSTTESGQELDLNAPTNEQRDAGDRAKEDFISDEEAEVSSGTVIISNVSQNQGVVTVRTVISGGVAGTSCTVSVADTNGGTYSKTVDVQNLGTYYVCAGFDIPTSELSAGEWVIKVVYIDTDAAESEATTSFEVSGV